MAWLVRRFLRFLLLRTIEFTLFVPFVRMSVYVCTVLYRNPYSVQIITKTPNSDLSYLYYPLPLDS